MNKSSVVQSFSSFPGSFSDAGAIKAGMEVVVSLLLASYVLLIQAANTVSLAGDRCLCFKCFVGMFQFYLLIFSCICYY